MCNFTSFFYYFSKLFSIFQFQAEQMFFNLSLEILSNIIQKLFITFPFTFHSFLSVSFQSFKYFALSKSKSTQLLYRRLLQMSIFTSQHDYPIAFSFVQL